MIVVSLRALYAWSIWLYKYVVVRLNIHWLDDTTGLELVVQS